MQLTFLSGGRAIRLDAVEPAGNGRHPAIFLLHGAGGNVNFWLERITPLIARLGIAVYAARYFDRTGTTRADARTLSDGKHVPLWIETVKDAAACIKARPGVDSAKFALVGISLGAFLALAAAAEGLPVRAIVDISGGLVEPYAAQATSAFPPTLIVHGETDSVVPVAMAHQLQQRLERLGVAHRLELLAAEGHWFSQAAQARILAAIGAFLHPYL